MWDEGEVAVDFDSRTVSFAFGERDTPVPAYAATIHKSQGSEYAAVVIPVMSQHHTMLQRNLLYTGVTRGRKLAVLVGQKRPWRSRSGTFRDVAAGPSLTSGSQRERRADRLGVRCRKRPPTQGSRPLAAAGSAEKTEISQPGS